jgi:outer membrane immunogenic protein
MKLKSLSAAVLASAFFAHAASAQDVITTSGTDWRGFYVGANLGGAWNSTCNSWTPSGPIIDPAVATAFYNRNCPNNGTFVGGVQIGYNFQKDQLVWGFGLDYDAWSAKNRNQSFTYTGAVIPDGTYNFSGKVSPNGFGILGPRIGYAVDQWLTYFRLGGVFTGGSHTSTASYTPAGATAPTASFTGGKNFNTSGFGVGAGFEYMLPESWSFRAEYTHVSLGKGTNSVTTCTGTVANCAAFAGVSLDNIHNSFTANIFRVGLNYKF